MTKQQVVNALQMDITKLLAERETAYAEGWHDDDISDINAELHELEDRLERAQKRLAKAAS